MAQVRATAGGRDVEYWLIEFDKHGNEVLESGGLGSEEMLEALGRSTATDVVLLSHGWNSSWEGAQHQYTAWVSAFLRGRPREDPRPFRPFFVGVHWPSLAFAPTRIERDTMKTLSASRATAPPDSSESLDTSEPVTVDEAIDAYARLLGDTTAIREALRKVLVAEATGTPLESSPAGREGLRELQEATFLVEPPLPSDDDEDVAFAEVVSGSVLPVLGGNSPAKLLGLPLVALRQFSFWKMKQRAYTIGAAGVAPLLNELQRAAGENARVHVVGHSFGCIVVGGAVLAEGRGPTKAVGSVLLVQGALSLWVLADDAYGTGRRGRFRPLRDRRFVDGPIVTSQSSWDYALARFYPAGVRAAVWTPGGPDHLVLGNRKKVPKWGALGTFGAQGARTQDLRLRDVSDDTHFDRGVIYNVECDDVIDDVEGGGWGGAHNDIAHASIGRLWWATALSAT
ncbi:hypothetical protein ACFVSU_14345 [Microbacterium sp. NPDC058062]|uniref:hypothetical protein n=1 Tax=Microbacterium sp. NPDC058062 TaxID=3346320 RepID=UPI0036DDB1E8